MVLNIKSFFRRGINIYLNIITCKDNIFILSKLQKYVLHWYHVYLLHPEMDRTEVMIHQHLYWLGIRHAVWKEVTNCYACQHTKQSNKKYGKLPDKEAEEILWNKLCVYIIGTHAIRVKEQKENLHLKSFMIIYPVTVWFEIM